MCKACKNGTLVAGYKWKYVEKENSKPTHESWKILKDYPKYKISNTGEVFSTWRNRNLAMTNLGRYKRVHLINKDKKRETLFVHRLVALAYIPNPNKHPLINHKDGDPSNNNVANLEWCDYKYNCKHAMETGLCHKRGKRVACMNSTGIILCQFDSMKDAAAYIEHKSTTRISKACNKRCNIVTAGGYHWKFV